MRNTEILESEESLQEGSRIFHPVRGGGEISFENVAFGYDASQPVLKRINLHVAAGQKIAIVGPTGAGKSTLVSLLPRFYDPQSGRVKIDGVDIREFQLKSLRRQIAMILQPPVVFPLTIRENIAYGRPDASFEDIVSAARWHRFMSLSKNFPTNMTRWLASKGPLCRKDRNYALLSRGGSYSMRQS